MAEDIKKGPRTSDESFLIEHIDTSVKELSAIPELIKNGKTDEAKHCFAEYIRALLSSKKLIKNWTSANYSAEALERLTARANDVMDYKFVSCGIPWQFKDKKIDWEFNPTYNAYCEWPWQLSRHPEWDTLAQYYVATGDENAAKTYVDMAYSWLEQAIVPENVNGYRTICWRTIEAGIRMLPWSMQIQAFIGSENLTDDFITKYFISIYEHGWRLRNFCTHGNWLLMEMHGLVRIGVLYPFLKDAEEWRVYALRRLKEELDVQVYPDGFQYELSTNYHNVVDSNYYSVLEMYRRLELTPPDFLEKGLEKLYDMYPHLTRPDRRLPDLNDGNEMRIEGKMHIASGLYPERSDFKWFATNGKEGCAPDYLSYAFPYAGAVVMRTSWDSDAIWAYMDCSPFGRGHQHEDKLNVLLNAYGKKLLTEGGCYDYDTSEMRKYVLSTRAHNTVRINGCDQNVRKTYTWADEEINKKAEFLFDVNAEREIAEAEFNGGYGEAQEKVIHRRKLIFVKNTDQPFFVVIDRFIAPDHSERSYETMWHLENCELSINGINANGDFGDGVGLTLAFSDADAELRNVCGQHEPVYQGWMPIRPSGPHEHRPIPTPIYYGSFKGSKRTVTVLAPYKNGASRIASVSASDDINDTSFTVTMKDGPIVMMDEND